MLRTSKKKLAVLQQQVHCLSLLRQLYNLEATAFNRRFACLAALMQKNSAKELASEAQVSAETGARSAPSGDARNSAFLSRARAARRE